MEKFLEDLNYCSEHYKETEKDAKCCGGISYEYLTKVCNPVELHHVYDIIIKLCATNYILLFDYDFFLNHYVGIFKKIFFCLKQEEELFIKYTRNYDDDEYIRKMRHLHIYYLYKDKLRIMEGFLLDDSWMVAFNHSKILLNMFYNLYVENLIDKKDMLDCFNGAMSICHNLNYLHYDGAVHPLKTMYISLLNKDNEEPCYKNMLFK